MPAHCPTCGQPIPDLGQQIDRIQAEVARYYDIPFGAILGPDKHRLYSRPRQIAYWLAQQTTPYTVAKIARAFRRDHTTVCYGIMRIDRRALEDPLMGELGELQERLTNGHG